MTSPSTTTDTRAGTVPRSALKRQRFDYAKQGADVSRVYLLLLKWPIYAFRLLRRGRFSTIAELRKDSARIEAQRLHQTFSHEELSSEEKRDDESILKDLFGDKRIALGWAAFLSLLLLADSVVPKLSELTAVLLIGGSVSAIMVALSSITREASGNRSVGPRRGSEDKAAQVSSPRSVTTVLMEGLGGIFFVVSTFPFALPWVLAFFFPRECLLFFTVWAVFGAIVNEVSVLVSHKRVMKGAPIPLPTIPEGKSDAADDASSVGVPSEISVVSSSTSSAIRRRKRKTTAQRVATLANFTLEDKQDLEDFIVSDEGLKWWAAFLVMQGTISAGAVFLSLATELWLLKDPNHPELSVLALFMSLSMFCESFWMTYAVGGRWLHFRQKWRFFQPLRGGTTFSMMQITSWTFFFAFLLMTGSDLREPLRRALLPLVENGRVSSWGFELLDESIMARLQTLSRAFGLSILPRGTVQVFAILAELIMLVSLPLYRGPVDEHYLEGAGEEEGEELASSASSPQDRHDDTAAPEPIPSPAISVSPLSEPPLANSTTPLPPLTRQTSDEATIATTGVTNRLYTRSDPEYESTILKRQRRSMRSQFSVPLWELAADALRTAWLSPIILTLVKPEVTLFLFGFFLSAYVHDAEIPYSGGRRIYLPAFIATLELMYIPTYFGNPRRTGRRRWHSIRGTWVADEVACYFHTTIVREKELNPSERHIFGYHPHAMFPMGAAYIHNTTQWLALFPNIVCVSLVATVTHIVPLLREVTQYLGGIEVTAGSFNDALRRFRHLMLVPGGQHEMLLFPDDPDERLISTKHKGFVRLAMVGAHERPDEPVNLVPMYVFGEADMFYNAFPAPLSLQRWFVKKLRLNPAFLPIGRFNLAGVPKRVPVTLVVGEPLRVPVVEGGHPTEKQIDLLHRRYFSALQEVFERHKGMIDTDATARMGFVPPLQPLTQAEFEREWEISKSDFVPADKVKRDRDPPPVAEYGIAIVLANLALWLPYFFFAN